MIIGIDIGGTKTLVVNYHSDGSINEQVRFTTNVDYATFLADLKDAIATINTTDATVCCAAVPGLLDREKGLVYALGNLPWENKSIAQDIAQATGIKNVIIENDTKLAAFAEAYHLNQSESRILYLTISTGINGALVTNNQLSQDVIDMEMGKMPLLYDGKMTRWEDFASGRAFHERYGMFGSEVDDPTIWEEYAQTVAEGLTIGCAIFQLDTIIFGGGLGQYAKHFIPFLKPHIAQLHTVIKKPNQLLPAHYGENSVIHGCYYYANDTIS